MKYRPGKKKLKEVNSGAFSLLTFYTMGKESSHFLPKISSSFYTHALSLSASMSQHILLFGILPFNYNTMNFGLIKTQSSASAFRPQIV